MKHRTVIFILVIAAALLASSCTPGSLLTTGAKAPEFELFDANGQTVRLADYAGRPVMLDFWGTN
jgi:cytochrome oxidase Cu insertion factor (SCO1/SenC/PrrC family)